MAVMGRFVSLAFKRGRSMGIGNRESASISLLSLF